MHKQQGMTTIGMLLLSFIMIMLGIVIMRTIPVYLENYTLNSAISSLQTIPASEFSGEMSSNVELLKHKLLNRIDMNGLDSTLIDKIKFTPKDGRGYIVTVRYTVQKHLFYNVSLLYDFNNVREITIASE
jgi:hypothetical protein